MRTMEDRNQLEQIVPGNQRFVDALAKNGAGYYEALLDKETGLVWQRPLLML